MLPWLCFSRTEYTTGQIGGHGPFGLIDRRHPEQVLYLRGARTNLFHE
jgi:hypothetical protein